MSRLSYQGVLRILRYNGRFFAFSSVLAALLGWAAYSKILAPWASPPAALLASATFAFMASSLAVSHYIYDRSTLNRWDWLVGRLLERPRAWTSIHAGLDEASPALRRLFPEAAGTVFDVFDPLEMPEPSIAVARRLEAPPEPAKRASIFGLPLADGASDLVVLFFVAHELRRSASRERAFTELARVVAPAGRVLLVEHLRDLMNALAFGPGVFHFLPRREWLRLAATSGLSVEQEVLLTPFVRAFFLAKDA